MAEFWGTYEFKADSPSDADGWARSIAREQTIECIDEAVPHGFILDYVLAQVETVEDQGGGIYRARIRYRSDITGGELPQMMNVLYGNCSIHVAVKLVGIELSAEVQSMFPGPQFGAKGVRDIVGGSGPMVCAVLKPMGLSADELAERAYQCVLGGIDLIKDDHSLAMQHWAPFEPRVEAISKAVAKANAETGNTTIYAPSMLCPVDKLEERARFAVEAGAGGYLVMPGLTGFDSVRFLAGTPELSRPIMFHPSGMGSFTNAGLNGLSHSVMYASYPRLMGADISIYPSFGGRYGFSKELCVQVAQDCRDPNGPFIPILPSPGGGMNLELAPLLREMYGPEAVFLFGGGAMRYKDEIASGIRELKAALTGG
ncbi:RuBisCO large subunit C-terminal-like domain-containing protein [uncultured Tateyamaria sp.]|uniref:RuBisCO large subunit C-terminal-like domain-containing protein n=1 Tax=uncultured Tateyamaria sp. TaxID=455651 RepID=UPI0026021ADC|nr:RuBisCO large subunit C-terminal-like domain-containing protein [uncultured Tateyamaria sp.]